MIASEQKIDNQWLLQWRQAITGGAILELGCGTGVDTAALAQWAKFIICTDLKPGAGYGKQTHCVQLDHSRPLPFSGLFDVVVASLCLHYFSWQVTVSIMREIAAVLRPGGLLIGRVNSVYDAHYGAIGHAEIAPGLYAVDGVTKRFFNQQQILRLCAKGWTIETLKHKCIDRYEKPKWIWEFGARCASRGDTAYQTSPQVAANKAK